MSLVLILGSLQSVTFAEEVVELVADNFDKHIKENQKTLVLFYAPWCGHCRKLSPEFEEAAVELKAQSLKAKLAKIDATTHKDTAKGQEVASYPTLVWYEDSVRRKFDGGRTSESIVSWVRGRLEPAVQETAPPTVNAGDIPNLVLTGKELAPGFLEAARRNRKKAGFYFVKKDVPSHIGLTHHGEEPEELPFSDDPDLITKFLDDHMFPSFGIMGANTFDRYIEAGKGVVWGLFDQTGTDVEGAAKTNRPMMTQLAQQFKGKFYMTYCDTAEFKTVLDNVLGVTKFPAIALQLKAGDTKRFVHYGEMTTPAIAQFIRLAESGGLQPHLKSEDIPTTKSTPQKVVSKTFMAEVFDPKKDVVLEISAPWCGQCKKMQPEYLKLAEKVRDEDFSDLLKVATIDGTLNDSPAETLEWTSFPSIYFVKAGHKEALLYDGERTAKAIFRYIKKHSTHAEEIQTRIRRQAEKDTKAHEL